MRKKSLSLLGVLVLIVGIFLCRSYLPTGRNTEPSEPQASSIVTEATASPTVSQKYAFRSQKLLKEHFDKHGRDMGFASASEYEQAADRVIRDPDALHKLEAEDGDDIYYIEATNEFVVLSKDGYIRTYFLPDAGKAYYDRQ